MACERTSEGICKKSLEVMAKNSDAFYTKDHVISRYYGSERKFWVIAAVNAQFSAFCQNVIDMTEALVQKSNDNYEYAIDKGKMSQLRNDVEKDMWRLLACSNEDAGTWGEVICSVGHDAQKAIDQEYRNFCLLRDREWLTSFNSLRVVIDQAVIRKARNENPS
jgi:hypothetical protein